MNHHWGGRDGSPDAPLGRSKNGYRASPRVRTSGGTEQRGGTEPRLQSIIGNLSLGEDEQSRSVSDPVG